MILNGWVTPDGVLHGCYTRDRDYGHMRLARHLLVGLGCYREEDFWDPWRNVQDLNEYDEARWQGFICLVDGYGFVHNWEGKIDEVHEDFPITRAQLRTMLRWHDEMRELNPQKYERDGYDENRKQLLARCSHPEKIVKASGVDERCADCGEELIPWLAMR